MIDWTPSAIAIQVGPVPIYWYGVAYAAGLFAAYVVMTRQAQRFRQDPALLFNGMLVVALAALVGGRLYHVIDQWALYKDDLLKIVLPPYSGLGVYGGLVTGTLAFLLVCRYYRVSAWTWADVVAPGLFVMQAVGRWGNFFNQELYGPPTTLPWGIAIDCAHRVAPYLCPPGSDPAASLGQHFQPLFLYESISGIAGAAVLMWLSSRPRPWLRPGDLILIFFIWYAAVRFFLEYLRTGNWTLEGIPTAQIFSLLFAVGSVILLVYRHRTIPPGGAPVTEPAPSPPPDPDGEADLPPDPLT